MALLRFYAEGIRAGEDVTLSSEESRHASSVYRVRTGDRLHLIDGRGRLAEATVVDASSRSLVCAVSCVEEHPPLADVELWCAFPRAGGADDVVRRAIEAGATVIRPLLTTRGVWRADDAQGAKLLDRWHRIALAALKQCGGLWLPRFDSAVDMKKLPRVGDALLYFGSTGPTIPSLINTPPPINPRRLIALVGPEGGFSDDEEQLLLSAGAHATSLGPHILRVETAATVLISILRMHRP